MADTQYALFRDLDRHCVAGGAQPADCKEGVRRKRACIESALNCDNPLVAEVLKGTTSFTAIYDSYSHAFRGIRRFLPRPDDSRLNDRLEQFAKIVPNVRHFTHRSIFATDNPVTCAVYGVVATLPVGLVWNHAVGSDSDGAVLDAVTWLALALGLGLAGFVAGLYSVFKYRTRDPRTIHAREAAVYMDLNYNCHRSFDDEAWAKFVALKTTPPGSGPQRPGAPHTPPTAHPATT